MEAHYVIRKPMLTEKSTGLMNDLNQYCFEVDRRARKPEIKAAIEEIYKVRVAEVKTSRLKGKHRRLRYGWVTEQEVKKAIVRLHPDDRIELF